MIELSPFTGLPSYSDVQIIQSHITKMIHCQQKHQFQQLKQTTNKLIFHLFHLYSKLSSSSITVDHYKRIFYQQFRSHIWQILGEWVCGLVWSFGTNEHSLWKNLLLSDYLQCVFIRCFLLVLYHIIYQRSN